MKTQKRKLDEAEKSKIQWQITGIVISVMGISILCATGLYHFRRKNNGQNQNVEVFLGIDDTYATAERFFTHSIPRNAFQGDVYSLKAMTVEQLDLPGWLSFDGETQTFLGVPATSDVGTYMIEVTAFSFSGMSTSTTFLIQVRPLNQINDNNNDNTDSKRNIVCDWDQQTIKASLILDINMNSLTPVEKVSILQKWSSHLSQSVHSLTLGLKGEGSIFNKVAGIKILVAGPGDANPQTLNRGVVLTWGIGCGDFSQKLEIEAVITLNIKNGNIKHVLGYSVIGWYVTENMPVGGVEMLRKKRQVSAFRTPVPTPTISSMLPSSVIDVTPSFSQEYTSSILPTISSFPETTPTATVTEVINVTSSSVIFNETTASVTGTINGTAAVTSVTPSLPPISQSPTVINTTPSNNSTISMEQTTAILPSNNTGGVNITDEFNATTPYVNVTTANPTDSGNVSTEVPATTNSTFTGFSSTTTTNSSDVTITSLLGNNTTVFVNDTGVMTTPTVMTNVTGTFLTTELIQGNTSSNASVTSSPSIDFMTTVGLNATVNVSIVFTTDSVSTSNMSTAVNISTTAVPSINVTSSSINMTTLNISTVDTDSTDSSSTTPVTTAFIQDMNITTLGTNTTTTLSPLNLTSNTVTTESTNVTKVVTQNATEINDVTTDVNNVTTGMINITTAGTTQSDNFTSVMTGSAEVTTQPSNTSTVGSTNVTPEMTTQVLDVTTIGNITTEITTQLPNITDKTTQDINTTPTQIITTEQITQVTNITTAPNKLSLPVTNVTMSQANVTMSQATTPVVGVTTVNTGEVTTSTNKTFDTTIQAEISTGAVTPSIESAPIVANAIDYIQTYLGTHFEFQVPADTFYDHQDGGTRNLSLQLYRETLKPISADYWVQFDTNLQLIYGIPLQSDFDVGKGQHKVVLVANDSSGLGVSTLIMMGINSSSIVNTSFVFYVDILLNSLIIGNNNKVVPYTTQDIINLMNKIALYFGDSTAQYVSLVEINNIDNSSVIVKWTNNTISKEVCQNDTILQLYSKISLNGDVSKLRTFMLPSFAIKTTGVEWLGVCANVTTTGSSTDLNILLVTVVPALAVILIILIVIFCICCLHKRRRKAGRYIPDDEKPIFSNNRKPVILQGEIDINDPTSKPRKPVFMEADSDPSFAYSNPGYQGPEPSKKRAPPPYSSRPDLREAPPALGASNDFPDEPVPYSGEMSAPYDFVPFNRRKSSPPIYRLPPPYIESPGFSQI